MKGCHLFNFLLHNKCLTAKCWLTPLERGSIHIKLFMTGQKKDDFYTGDCLIEVTSWAGLVVYWQHYFIILLPYKENKIFLHIEIILKLSYLLLNIFPLISLSDIVSINLVTWYWNLSVSVHQVHYDITDKNKTSVWKDSTYQVGVTQTLELIYRSVCIKRISTLPIKTEKCQFWRTRHTLSLVSQLVLSDSPLFYIYYIYSQTCIKRSPME